MPPGTGPRCTRWVQGVVAHRHRHGQRPVGQLRVVLLAQREPQDPARAHVKHRVKVELAFIGGDLGAVAVPLAVDGARAEVSPDQQSLLQRRGLWDDGRLITAGRDEAHTGQGEEDQPAGGPGGPSGIQAGHLGLWCDLGADLPFDEAEHQ